MERYKNIGIKLTPQRLAILSYLDGNKDHPSASNIHAEVSIRFPTMSIATVYNTIDILKQHGDILELTIDPDKKRFDPNTQLHHHLICVSCKKIIDIYRRYDLSLSDLEKASFEITGNHVEFYGKCPACTMVKSDKVVKT